MQKKSAITIERNTRAYKHKHTRVRIHKHEYLRRAADWLLGIPRAKKLVHLAQNYAISENLIRKNALDTVALRLY